MPTYTNLLDLIPAQADGASRFGVHFISTWLRCPFEAALEHLAPHPSGGRGLTRQYKARPLLAGGGFHAAIDPWYRSRCLNPSTGAWCPDTGKPDLERALFELDTWVASHATQWEDPVERETDHQLIRGWMQRYHDYYGPTGTHPDFPNLQVYVDETGPWIEREVTIPVADGLFYTVRIDLVASDLGHPCVYEHKTTAASSYHTLLKSMHLSAQPTGELFGLKVARALPFLPVACVVNVLNKNPGKMANAKTPPFGRERVSRTEADIGRFESNLLLWLSRIDEWLGAYKHLVSTGVEPYDAIAQVFPRNGTITGTCYRFNRACDFVPMCSMVGREALSAHAYNPRHRPTGEAAEPASTVSTATGPETAPIGLYEEEYLP